VDNKRSFIVVEWDLCCFLPNVEEEEEDVEVLVFTGRGEKPG